MRRSVRWLLLLLVITASAGLSRPLPTSATPVPPRYTVTELPTLGGDFTYAYDINDAGQVVGESRTGVVDQGSRAFSYDNGVMTDLSPVVGGNSIAKKINNAGQIIGFSSSQGQAGHAFLYANGQATTGPLDTSGGPVEFSALNDAGVIVARVDRGINYSRKPRSFLYQNGALTPIPFGPTDADSCGGFSAFAINNARQILGSLYGECERFPARHPVLYRDGDVVDLTAVGLLGADALNNRGQILGYGNQGALVYGPDGFLLPGGYADRGISYTDLNDAGVVIGYGTVGAAYPHDRHAFIYRGGALADLNDLISPEGEWVLREATALNNRGQIVGYGWHNGVEHAFLLTPTFTDLPTNHPYYDALLELAGRGIIQGYGDGSIGPDDSVLRAQAAALIARAFGWDAEDWTDTAFPDQGEVDNDLWRNVRTLAHYGVALGFPDGTYNPTGAVAEQQAALLVARTMIQRGTWQLQADTNPYPNLPSGSAREQADRQAIATYVHYVGALPDRPIGQPWPTWDHPATRGWTAAALWQALQAMP